MPSTVSTDDHLHVRISPRILTAVRRQASKDELSISDVTRVLLKEYSKGEITVDISAKRKKS